MTEKTRTERQLLESIRQAKTAEKGADTQPESADPATPPQPRPKATPQRTRPAAKNGDRAQQPPSRRATRRDRASGYQSPGRVWPD